MNLDVARERLYSPRVYPFMVVALILGVIGVFYVFGVNTNLRWVKAVMGMAVVGGIIALPLSAGIGIFLVATLFPANIVIGPTNFVLVTLAFVSWLARARLGRAPAPERTPCDVALIVLTLGYALSWPSVTRESGPMIQAWWYTQNHIGSLMIFYLTYAAVQRHSDVIALVRAMHVVAGIIYVTSIVEVATGISITGLGKIGEASYRLGGGVIRSGGLLGSHDMLADFCSIHFPLHVYLFLTSRRGLARLFYASMGVGALVVLFLTSNRGGLVGLFTGIVYLALLARRRIGTSTLVVGSAAVATLLIAVDTVLSQTGRTLSVFYRLFHTKFYGVLPETRVGVFEHVKYRLLHNPLLGEGPYYRLSLPDRDVFVFWPHNAFAYYWITVGITGLVGFVWTMVTVLRKTWAERARRLGVNPTRDLLLVFHVMMVVFVVSQQRTDFQRGFTFTYYVFFMLGATMGLWKIARRTEPEAAARGRR